MAGIERVTRQLVALLAVLLEAYVREEDLHGYAIMKRAHLNGPSTYRNLDRLEDAQLVEVQWEELPPGDDRPRRCYYRLNAGRSHGPRDYCRTAPGPSSKPGTHTIRASAAARPRHANRRLPWPCRRCPVSREILVAVLVTLIVDETTGLSRWSAAKLAHWAANHIYPADVERAQKRAEEWDALISKSIPTNIAALCFGLGLGAAAVACMAKRRAAVIVSTLSRVYAVPPADRLAERNERRAAEYRQASLALLRAASELRLRVADTPHYSPEYLCVHLAQIRSEAVNTQLQAVNVALLAPDAPAGSAERLGEAASRLADATERAISDAGLMTSIPEFTELDQNMKAFKQDAVAVSRDLASSGTVPVSGRAQGAAEHTPRPRPAQSRGDFL